jgi:hypothetical protein
MGEDTTVIITSCGRHDLLLRTLLSLRAFNTDRHTGDVLVIEDGAADPSALCARFGAKLIRTGRKMGQVAAIDLAYSYVTTPYIFHCEDDWEFYRAGFVERSRAVLEADLSSVCVWLRSWGDTNGHPLSFRSPCRTFGVLSSDYLYHDVSWSGFSFNPGLRRLSDYIRVGPFARLVAAAEGPVEAVIGGTYRSLGFRAVILDEGGFVRHTGWGRHVDEA